MKIQKIFIEFLKRGGCFKSYIREWVNQPKDKRYPRPIKDKTEYIMRAFRWGRN